ncbi:hypothetical protein [Myroides sp. N17-2]|uniref:hypothetical protein n=1 Tax=Myroides sp. N17-2 TaxID=2030799 RepID=UPI000EFA66E3|nr:hypothetical protein [Myroides sp. N17-2]
MNKSYITSIGLSLFLAIATSACKKTIEESNPNVDQYEEAPLYTDSEEPEEEPTEEYTTIDYTFPETGKSITDFIPKGTPFEIQHEAKGDLNNDGLKDYAIVLTDKTHLYDERPMLIVLQQTDGTYRLDKMSKVVMPSKYFKASNYDNEEITIEKHQLVIHLYNEYASGNTKYKFSYQDKELYLSQLDDYSRGSGIHIFLSVDFFSEKIKLETGDANTDPETEKTEYFDMPVYQFTLEKDCPQYILNDIYKIIFNPNNNQL